MDRCTGIVVIDELGSEEAVMVLEVAILDVKTGQNEAFEAAFQQASPLIASIPGYVSHKLQHCVENPQRYVLLAY